MWNIRHPLSSLLVALFLLSGQAVSEEEEQKQAFSLPFSPSVGQEEGRPLLAVAETSPSSPSIRPFLVLPIASSDEELKLHLSLGWQDLLMGWEESAERHLTKALQRDERCLLAHIGWALLPSSSHTEEHLQTLRRLCEQADHLSLTPAEASYLSIFLKAAQRHLAEAGQEMSAYADRYRADLFAAVWALQLLHCSDAAYTSEGQASPLQQEALRRAEILSKAQPLHPLVCYLRAYLEETAPTVSTEALEAAQRSAELMPEHPMPELLLGHLLYRSGREEESISHFQRAANLAKKNLSVEKESDSSLALTARLYEATALWSVGRDRESLRLRRTLCALPLSSQATVSSQDATPRMDSPQAITPQDTLLRWEARTLPLRILVLRKEVPTQGEIDAAYRAAAPDVSSSSLDPVLEERNCLRAVLSARKKARAGDMKEAVRSLQLAEEAFSRFEATLEQARRISSEWVTPWYRAQEACLVALCAAKAEVYPSSADIWKENQQRATHAPILLMPPVIPLRSATVTRTSSSTLSPPSVPKKKTSAASQERTARKKPSQTNKAKKKRKNAKR